MRWQAPPSSRWVPSHYMSWEAAQREARNLNREGVDWGSRVFTGPRRSRRVFYPGRGSGGYGYYGAGCWDGFFPGLCGTGSGWGPAWGAGALCDPDYGCEGNGYLNDSGITGGPDTGTGQLQEGSVEEMGTYWVHGWPAEDSSAGDAGANLYEEKRATVSKPTVILFLKDG